MESLLEEYEGSLKTLKRIRREAPAEDHKLCNGMVSSLEFSTKWIRTGSMPERTIEYGSYPSEAFEGFENDLSGSFIDGFSKDAFDRADERIDAEYRRRRRLNA